MITTRLLNKLVPAIALAMVAGAAAVTAGPARAHGSNASEASSLSLSLPVAVSIAGPVLLVAGSAAFTLVAVEASAVGTVWVLERASDGVRMSLRFTGHVTGHVSAAVGTALVVSAVSTGWVISAAGAALAFIPNELGRALLHNERITR